MGVAVLVMFLSETDSEPSASKLSTLCSLAGSRDRTDQQRISKQTFETADCTKSHSLRSELPKSLFSDSTYEYSNSQNLIKKPESPQFEQAWHYSLQDFRPPSLSPECHLTRQICHRDTDRHHCVTTRGAATRLYAVPPCTGIRKPVSCTRQ